MPSNFSSGLARRLDRIKSENLIGTDGVESAAGWSRGRSLRLVGQAAEATLAEALPPPLPVVLEWRKRRGGPPPWRSPRAIPGGPRPRSPSGSRFPTARPWRWVRLTRKRSRWAGRPSSTWLAYMRGRERAARNLNTRQNSRSSGGGELVAGASGAPANQFLYYRHFKTKEQDRL